ncbi:hypothetical protein E3N88_24812 [Mikania micrantha]|uniref:Uncharacterized protein n=1 Tax=Mikania micrantha TaxID=192012 RepID=A0A5N6N378_9ASTR|nr:hypothetical protein E3N88_24812 [Mikania micrantha]
MGITLNKLVEIWRLRFLGARFPPFIPHFPSFGSSVASATNRSKSTTSCAPCPAALRRPPATTGAPPAFVASLAATDVQTNRYFVKLD